MEKKVEFEKKEKFEDIYNGYFDEYGVDLWVLFEKDKNNQQWMMLHTATRWQLNEMEEYAKHLAEKFPNKQFILHYYQSVATRGIIEHERNIK